MFLIANLPATETPEKRGEKKEKKLLTVDSLQEKHPIFREQNEINK
jgi:hypothetical protein